MWKFILNLIIAPAIAIEALALAGGSNGDDDSKSDKKKRIETLKKDTCMRNYANSRLKGISKAVSCMKKII